MKKAIVFTVAAVAMFAAQAQASSLTSEAFLAKLRSMSVEQVEAKLTSKMCVLFAKRAVKVASGRVVMRAINEGTQDKAIGAMGYLAEHAKELTVLTALSIDQDREGLAAALKIMGETGSTKVLDKYLIVHFINALDTIRGEN